MRPYSIGGKQLDPKICDVLFSMVLSVTATSAGKAGAGRSAVSWLCCPVFSHCTLLRSFLQLSCSDNGCSYLSALMWTLASAAFFLCLLQISKVCLPAPCKFEISFNLKEIGKEMIELLLISCLVPCALLVQLSFYWLSIVRSLSVNNAESRKRKHRQIEKGPVLTTFA